jgi:hypothetical protein
MAKTQADIRSLGRCHTNKAILALSRIVSQGKSESAPVAAAVALLDRGWGKPEQSLEINDRRELRQYSDDELIAIIAGSSVPIAEPAEPQLLPAPKNSHRA